MKIKILQIVPSLSLANGVAAYLESYYRFMNLSNFETTILVLNDDDKGRYETFKALNCKIIEMFKCESWTAYLKKIDDFFSKNMFDIVHCHTANYGAFYMHYAKKYGVKCRILHSHANRSADKFLRSIRNNLLIPCAVFNSNYYLACSNDAGKFMFHKRKYNIMINGVDYTKYRYNKKIRDKYRKEFGFENRYVIGTFGRLCNQKNQLFTLDIIKELVKVNSKILLVIIGDGELKQKIVKKVEYLKLNNNVLILKSRNDLNLFYNSLDIFLLPSTYEGLGIVLIESQINGLYTFTSKRRVPQEAKISNLLEFVNLNNNPKEWANRINEKMAISRNKVVECNSSYSIVTNAKKLEKFYNKIAKR